MIARLRLLVLCSSTCIVLLVLFHLYANRLATFKQVELYLPQLGGEALVVSRPHNDTHDKLDDGVEASLIEESGSNLAPSQFVDEENEVEESTRPSTRPTSKEPTEPSVPVASLSLRPQATQASQFSTPSSKPAEPTGAIVAAVGLESDLSWVEEIDNPFWILHRYNFDDPSPPPNTTFPINKGNEGMMYLSYIINNYNILPDYSIFIHGHRTSWHQEGDIVNLINNIRLPALQRAGYVPLRCDWYPSCPKEIRPVKHDAVVWGPGVHRADAEYEIGHAWQELFGPFAELPETIASQCCAQFAVTRAAIHGRTKADYERIRDWLVNTPLINDISGRVIEKLWAYIMTKDAVRCPPPQQCACEYFGQCEGKKWPVPPNGLEMWKDGEEMPVLEWSETGVKG